MLVEEAGFHRRVFGFLLFGALFGACFVARRAGLLLLFWPGPLLPSAVSICVKASPASSSCCRLPLIEL